MLANGMREIQHYLLGAQGQEVLYYKIKGMGHRWTNPTQTSGGLWKMFGGASHNIGFRGHSWEFSPRHSKR